MVREVPGSGCAGAEWRLACSMLNPVHTYTTNTLPIFGNVKNSSLAVHQQKITEQNIQGTLEVVEAAEARLEPEVATITNNMVIDSSKEPHNMPTTPLNATPQPEPYTYPPFTLLDLQTNPKEPLYTEINIPLPSLQKTPYSTLRNRAHSLHSSLKPFHRRGSSSDSCASAQNRIAPRRSHEEPVVKSREVAAAMDLSKRHRRTRTVDALAVVPAVLVLRAELFTPVREEEEGGKSRTEVKWEDGMI